MAESSAIRVNRRSMPAVRPVQSVRPSAPRHTRPFVRRGCVSTPLIPSPVRGRATRRTRGSIRNAPSSASSGFGIALTRVNAVFGGTAYAVYGGIYVAASLVWLWVVEGQRPTGSDVLGATMIVGALIIVGLTARPQ